MKIFYGRVSTQAQNLARQIQKAQDLGIEERFQFYDKATGANMNRPEWQRCLSILREGDILYVDSLDRIGRNYKEVSERLHYFKINKIGFVALDNELIDTTKNSEGINALIYDIVSSLFAYIAENERKEIKERQMAGIKLAIEKKEKGEGKYGRPRILPPDDFIISLRRIQRGELTATEYRKSKGLSKTTFYRLRKKVQKKF